MRKLRLRWHKVTCRVSDEDGGGDINAEFRNCGTPVQVSEKYE